jgi:hypothetical protein
MVDTRDELLSHVLDAAASIKKGEDQLRRTTREFESQNELGVDFRTFIVSYNKSITETLSLNENLQ